VIVEHLPSRRRDSSGRPGLGHATTARSCYCTAASGLGATVTALLVEDAGWRGAETVFLSAGDDAVARVYERLGFRQVGVHRAAEPAQ
jgi:hypothetical protein